MISVVKNNVMYAGIILMTGRLLKCLEIERNLNHKKEKKTDHFCCPPRCPCIVEIAYIVPRHLYYI